MSLDGQWELWAGQIWLILGRNNTLSGWDLGLFTSVQFSRENRGRPHPTSPWRSKKLNTFDERGGSEKMNTFEWNFRSFRSILKGIF
jgi:hypothetical protein